MAGLFGDAVDRAFSEFLRDVETHPRFENRGVNRRGEDAVLRALTTAKTWRIARRLGDHPDTEEIQVFHTGPDRRAGERTVFFLVTYIFAEDFLPSVEAGIERFRTEDRSKLDYGEITLGTIETTHYVAYAAHLPKVFCTDVRTPLIAHLSALADASLKLVGADG